MLSEEYFSSPTGRVKGDLPGIEVLGCDEAICCKTYGQKREEERDARAGKRGLMAGRRS